MGMTTYFVFGSLGSVISALELSSFRPNDTSSPEQALTASIRYETLNPIESCAFVSSISMSSTACSCSGFSDEIVNLLLSISILTPLNFSFASIDTRCSAGFMSLESKIMFVVVCAGITRL